MSIDRRSHDCAPPRPTLAASDGIGEPCCARHRASDPSQFARYHRGGESMTRRSHAPPRRSRSLASRCALLALVCSATTLGAQAVVVAPTGVIVGIVSEQATGQPLEASTILIVGTKLGGNTDRRGHFVIRGVPAGEFTVRAQRLGFKPDDASGSRGRERFGRRELLARPERGRAGDRRRHRHRRRGREAAARRADRHRGRRQARPRRSRSPICRARCRSRCPDCGPWTAAAARARRRTCAFAACRASA